MLEIPVAFAIAIVAVIVGTGIAAARRIPMRARLLLSFFFAMLASMGLLVGLRDGYNIEAARSIQPVIAMLIQPTLFLVFNSLTEEPPTPVWSLLIYHGWPAALVAIIMSSPSLQVVPIDVYVFSSMLFYLVNLVRLLRGGSDSFVQLTESGYKFAVIGLIGSISLFGFVLLVDAAIFISVRLFAGFLSDALVRASTIAIAAIVLVSAFYAAVILLRDTETGGKSESSKKSQAGSTKPTAHDKKTLEALDELLIERELYRDTDLTLARVARRMGVPARDISHAVNHCCSENFSRHMNGYRVRHAQELLKGTLAPVTEIMLESGFTTKSNFNTEFSRIVGMTPTEYRASPSKSA